MKGRQTMKTAGLCFALAFGSGLVFVPIRILWIVPAVGTRMAELLEAPLMLVVIILAARWVTRRIKVPPTASRRLVMGGMAFGHGSRA
jgi:membrane protein implicated in regulation of membrane protease activity